MWQIIVRSIFTPPMGLGAFDLIASERRITEVHVQRRRQHLRLEHRVHRRTRGVRGLDDAVHIGRNL